MAQNQSKNATEQEQKKKYDPRVNLPKERQFGQPNGNPRNPGGWKKEDSISYQYNRILRMTEVQFRRFANSKSTMTTAQRIALARIQDATKSGTLIGLRNTEEITNRTEGKAVQAIELENKTSEGVKGLTDEELNEAIFG